MTLSRKRLRPRTVLQSASVAVVAWLVAASQAFAAPALMPMPQTVENGGEALRVTGPLAVSLAGCRHAMVPAAAARFTEDLVKLAGAPAGGAAVQLAIRCAAADANALSLEAREGYRLAVTSAGVEIDADGETGVLRALATLRQLVDRDAKGPTLTATRIRDFPRFAWRGLMVDTARHFVEVETLKRQIDAMEIAKLNVLHLHLSDNEGFRVESRVFPKITEVATHGEYYTQSQVRDLVAYAAERGVRVVPEFDIPGHNKALLTAYPNLAVAPIDPKDPLANQKSSLNPASEETYRFLAKLLGEMADLFPDRQFHVGGDEVSDIAWKDSREVDAWKAKHGISSKLAAEAFFHARVRKILAAKGKTTIGWDEMADEPLPKDVIVQAWRTSNPVSTATARGNRVIVSAGFYMNDLRPASAHYGIELLDPMAHSTMTAEHLARVRQNPVVAAQVSDGLVAKQVPALNPQQEKLVIGGEAPLWAEIVSDEMLDGRLWPRALAIAERFWSAATLKDAGDMYARLLPAMDRLRALGLQDVGRRERMIARLAPGDTDVVARLIGIVAPTRHSANHMDAYISGKVAELVELTDAASTDGSPAIRFRNNVSAYLAGDRDCSAVIRGDLEAWRANAPAFAAVARGRPLLEKAIPTAQNAAALGELGITALDAIEGRRRVDAQTLKNGRDLLAKLKSYDDASKDLASISFTNQPPAALLILTAGDVGRLLDAAERSPPIN